MFKDFVAHLFPRVTIRKNLKIVYTFCLGGMAFTCFIILVLTGAMLLIYYIPSPELAYGSVVFLEEHVFGGRWLRNIHRLSCHVFLVLLFLHTLRVMLTGAFLKRGGNWVIGMILLFLAVFSGYTGYLLPMDQLSFWATQTGMELLRALPFGSDIYDLMVPDSVGGPLTLIRFYALHVFILPVLTLAFSFIHFFRVRRDKGVLPYL